MIIQRLFTNKENKASKNKRLLEDYANDRFAYPEYNTREKVLEQLERGKNDLYTVRKGKYRNPQGVPDNVWERMSERERVNAQLTHNARVLIYPEEGYNSGYSSLKHLRESVGLTNDEISSYIDNANLLRKYEEKSGIVKADPRRVPIEPAKHVHVSEHVPSRKLANAVAKKTRPAKYRKTYLEEVGAILRRK